MLRPKIVANIETIDSMIERRMHLLTEGVARSRSKKGMDFNMSRFLRDPDAKFITQRHVHEVHPPAAKAVTIEPKARVPRNTLPHRTRKRQTKHVDAEAREFRQPSEPLPNSTQIDEGEEKPEAAAGTTLQGLGPFGTRYATDFDVAPLAPGTYFHESSFIGSGDFAASLDFAGRDLDRPTGRIRVHVNGDVLEWGAWTEDVAAGLLRIPAAISTVLQSDDDTITLVLPNVDYLLRSSVRYLARCLAFIDPVDRRSCVQALQRLVEDLLEMTAEFAINAQSVVATRCLQYSVVLAKQTRLLSEHDHMPQQVRRPYVLSLACPAALARPAAASALATNLCCVLTAASS